jgi:hypothetical protein
MAAVASGYTTGMGLVIALIVLAVIFGAAGLFVAALKWLLIVAVVLVLVAVARAVMSNRTR